MPEVQVKPRISAADYAWLVAFEKIQQGEKVMLGEKEWTVHWKYQQNPYWLQLVTKCDKKMVRQGDPVIYELRAAR